MIEGSWGVLAGFDVVRLGEFEGFGMYGVGGLGRNLQNDPLYSSGSYIETRQVLPGVYRIWCIVMKV